MINYKEWKILNESLGSFTLGIRSPTSVGVAVDSSTPVDLEEKKMSDDEGDEESGEESEDDGCECQCGEKVKPESDNMCKKCGKSMKKEEVQTEDLLSVKYEMDLNKKYTSGLEDQDNTKKLCGIKGKD